MIFDTGHQVFSQAAAAALSPAGIEQYRIDRLLELRAMIDCLRAERSSELLRDVQAERARLCRP
jgi:hypothetical protein